MKSKARWAVPSERISACRNLRCGLSPSIILTAIATARAEPSADSEDGSGVPIITQLEILAALPKRMSLLQFFRPSLQRSDGRRWRSRKLPQSDALRCAASTEVQSSDARASEVRALHVCARAERDRAGHSVVPLLDLVVALDQGCSISGRLRQPRDMCGTPGCGWYKVGTRPRVYQPAMRIVEVGAGTCVAELGSQVQIPSAAFPA